MVPMMFAKECLGSFLVSPHSYHRLRLLTDLKHLSSYRFIFAAFIAADAGVPLSASGGEEEEAADAR